MFGSAKARTTVGLAVFLALLLGLGWFEFKRRTTEERVIEIAIVPAVPGASAQKNVSAPSSAAPAPKSASPTTTPPAQSDSSTARFDVVRVDGGGSVVAAGRAPAGSKIELVMGDKTLDSTVADAAGQWVIVPSDTLPPGEHELKLKSQIASAAPLASDQTVSVVVPAKPTEQSHVTVHEPGKPSTSGLESAAAPSASGDALQMQPADATPSAGTVTPPPSPAAANETQTAGGPGTTRTVPAEPSSPETKLSGGVIIDEVKPSGSSFTMRGHGPAGAPLRIYFNDTIVAEPTVAPDGTWSLSIQNGFVAGEYRIRVDQVQRNGHVIASVNRVLEHNPTVIAQATAPASPQPNAAATAPAARQAPPAETNTETAPKQPEPVAPPPGPTEAAPSADLPESRATQPTAETPAADIPAGSTAPTAAPPAPAPQVQAPQPNEPAAPAQSPSSTAQSPAPTDEAPQQNARAEPEANGSHLVIPKLSTVQVQPGENLWRLSRRQYGRGMHYGIIYQANRDQIRKPKLIYPGQVLVMPARDPAQPAQ